MTTIPAADAPLRAELMPEGAITGVTNAGWLMLAHVALMLLEFAGYVEIDGFSKMGCVNLRN